jgi:hypothetical protein
MSYSIPAQIIVTSEKIIYLRSGFYGSWHDSRQVQHTDVRSNFPSYLSPNQYIVADEAYAQREWLIGPYKQPRVRNLSDVEKNFNKVVTNQRIAVEHAIGRLKTRHPRLDNLNVRNTK